MTTNNSRFKDAWSVSLYLYNWSQILQYAKYQGCEFSADLLSYFLNRVLNLMDFIVINVGMLPVVLLVDS